LRAATVGPRAVAGCESCGRNGAAIGDVEYDRWLSLSACRGVDQLCVGEGEIALIGVARGNGDLMRRKLVRTSAPIFRNLRRVVPQVALANWVCCRAGRRSAQCST
jgi:hypothetical protein